MQWCGQSRPCVPRSAPSMHPWVTSRRHSSIAWDSRARRHNGALVRLRRILGDLPVECGHLLHCRCPLLAQSGHRDRGDLCPLSGVKRTCARASLCRWIVQEGRVSRKPRWRPARLPISRKPTVNSYQTCSCCRRGVDVSRLDRFRLPKGLPSANPRNHETRNGVPAMVSGWPE